MPSPVNHLTYTSTAVLENLFSVGIVNLRMRGIRTLAMFFAGCIIASHARAQLSNAEYRPDSSRVAANFPTAFRISPVPLFPAVTIIESGAAARHLPFFCESERRLDKKLPVPLRLRLGSLQQVDWLESKPSAIPPQP